MTFISLHNNNRISNMSNLGGFGSEPRVVEQDRTAASSGGIWGKVKDRAAVIKASFDAIETAVIKVREYEYGYGGVEFEYVVCYIRLRTMMLYHQRRNMFKVCTKSLNLLSITHRNCTLSSPSSICMILSPTALISCSTIDPKEVYRLINVQMRKDEWIVRDGDEFNDVRLSLNLSSSCTG